jgi:hypothetical protein
MKDIVSVVVREDLGDACLRDCESRSPSPHPSIGFGRMGVCW